jgi:hypothetical protein
MAPIIKLIPTGHDGPDVPRPDPTKSMTLATRAPSLLMQPTGKAPGWIQLDDPGLRSPSRDASAPDRKV